MSLDPLTEQKRALDRFAANERFFERSDLARYLSKPNERLKLHISQNGLNIQEGDRLLFDGALFERAKALAVNPLANPRYKAVAIQDFAKADINALTANGVNEILSLAESDLDFTPDRAHFDESAPLPPVVFCGVGAIAHIAILDENKRLSNGAIIFESDPEWFVISCYFLDYERFLDPAKANLLIVGGKMRSDLAREFFAIDRFSRGFIRLELIADNRAENIDAIRQIAIAHKECLRGWGTSEDELVGVKNAIANRAAPRLRKNAKIDFAIAVVGNGASLETLLDFLWDNQKKLVIFSAGTALKPLLSAGVTPDFHIEIERMDHLSAILQAAPIGDIALIAADLVDPSTLAAAKESFVFTRDGAAASSFSDDRVAFSSPIVGNAALALALEFSDEIYLCGLDAGFRRDKKMHAARSFYDERADASAEQIATRGNFSGDIWTNSLLAHSRAALEAAIASKPRAKVFNLSDGAFIVGAKPLQAAKTRIESRGDKAAAIAAIKSCFAVTSGANAIDIARELDAAKTALITTLNSFAPSDKKTLFAAAKAALEASHKLELNLRFGAPFLRGSFWHLTNALIKSLLCVKRSDTAALYKEGVLIIKATLERLRDLCAQIG
ncbi:MAG: DUF115 domain-containing protein [Helicobacteraceae bacterium]|nr:DUF115 domain-containing protein [Helicobacteraceae bacterium]